MNKLNPYPVTSSSDELKNATKIISKEHFKKNVTNEKLKVIDENIVKKPCDKIICNICGRHFTRSNKSKHNKTNHHKFCEELNKKWRDSILQQRV